MHMALSLDTWLQENALYCNRLHARLTPVQCERNQGNTADDRCSGCCGLEDQQREIPRQEPVVFFSDEPEDLDPAPMNEALSEALQEVLEWDGEEYPPDDDHDDPDEEPEELTRFQRELLVLIGDDLEERIIERKPEKKAAKRFAVFMGRCPRCRGYMVNIPERYGDIRDEDVHRCFNCGYRTSPGYEWNRLHEAV